MKYYMFNGTKVESNNEQNRKLNKSKVFKLIAIVICILLIVTFIVLYTTNEKCRIIFDKYIFRKEVYEDNLPSIAIEPSANINICAYDKYIGVLNENILKLYNKSGKEEHTIEIEISNPIFEANGNYLCVAEKNGQKIYLINGKNIVWQKNLEDKITSVNINKNGYVSVVASGASYKNVVYIFDSDGNEMFKYYFSETSVIDTDISDDNKFLAIAEVNFSGIVVQSTIKTISIEEAQKNSSESIKYSYVAATNDLIINIKYNNKNELICMYDEHIDILNGDQNAELISLREEEALFADVNLTSKAIKIIKKSDGPFNAKAELQITDIDSKKVSNYTLENIPKKVYVQGEIIAVDLGTSVVFINDRGWLVKKYQSSQEIQEIVFCNNVAGIVAKNTIKILPL